MENGGENLSEKDPKGGDEDQISFWRENWGGLKRAAVGHVAAVVFGIAILLISIAAAADPMQVSPHRLDGAGQEAGRVEYYLPYPGVLPDNVLYKLKAVRDRAVLWLTWGEEKKAQKELLYADKRINAAVFLVEGGKEDLGVSTATKAQKYLEQAVNRAIKVSGEGKDVKSLLATMADATSKHAEILEGLQAKATGGRKDAVAQSREITIMLHERVDQALLEAK